MDNIIQVRDLCKYFDTKAGRATALDHIGFDIARGDLAAIIGKSGSGKSTLINMLAGIDIPSSGSVRVLDHQLENMNEDQMARMRGTDIGVVFQFFQLLPVLNILENVMLPMDYLKAIPMREREERAFELLRLVNMEDMAYKLPSELSGGQQQKAAIARALANDPPIIIADEPTGNLDSAAAEKVFELFSELSGKGKTIVMVTHDNDIASRMSHVLTIKDGALVSENKKNAPKNEEKKEQEKEVKDASAKQENN